MREEPANETYDVPFAFRKIVLDAERLFVLVATRKYTCRPDCSKNYIVEACTALVGTLTLLLLGTASAVDYCEPRLPTLLRRL